MVYGFGSFEFSCQTLSRLSLTAHVFLGRPGLHASNQDISIAKVSIDGGFTWTSALPVRV